MEKIDSVCVFAGMPVEPGGEEAFTSTWTKFVQEPAFLFLTGVNQAGCFLLLDPASKSEVLFVPKKDPFKEFWVGKRIGYLEGDSDASRLTGVKDVRPAETFYDCLAEWTGRKGAKKFIYAFFHEKFQSDHNWKFKQKLERTLRPRHVAVRSVAALHWELRLPLDAPRIDEAKRAQVATDKAFRELL